MLKDRSTTVQASRSPPLQKSPRKVVNAPSEHISNGTSPLRVVPSTTRVRSLRSLPNLVGDDPEMALYETSNRVRRFISPIRVGKVPPKRFIMRFYTSNSVHLPTTVGMVPVKVSESS
jgi:hypothetical protein